MESNNQESLELDDYNEQNAIDFDKTFSESDLKAIEENDVAKTSEISKKKKQLRD